MLDDRKSHALLSTGRLEMGANATISQDEFFRVAVSALPTPAFGGVSNESQPKLLTANRSDRR